MNQSILLFERQLCFFLKPVLVIIFFFCICSDALYGQISIQDFSIWKYKILRVKSVEEYYLQNDQPKLISQSFYDSAGFVLERIFFANSLKDSILLREKYYYQIPYEVKVLRTGKYNDSIFYHYKNSILQSQQLYSTLPHSSFLIKPDLDTIIHQDDHSCFMKIMVNYRPSAVLIPLPIEHFLKWSVVKQNCIKNISYENKYEEYYNIYGQKTSELIYNSSNINQIDYTYNDYNELSEIHRFDKDLPDSGIENFISYEEYFPYLSFEYSEGQVRLFENELNAGIESIDQNVNTVEKKLRAIHYYTSSDLLEKTVTSQRTIQFKYNFY